MTYTSSSPRTAFPWSVPARRHTSRTTPTAACSAFTARLCRASRRAFECASSARPRREERAAKLGLRPGPSFNVRLVYWFSALRERDSGRSTAPSSRTTLLPWYSCIGTVERPDLEDRSSGDDAGTRERVHPRDRRSELQVPFPFDSWRLAAAQRTTVEASVEVAGGRGPWRACLGWIEPGGVCEFGALLIRYTPDDAALGSAWGPAAWRARRCARERDRLGGGDRRKRRVRAGHADAGRRGIALPSWPASFLARAELWLREPC